MPIEVTHVILALLFAKVWLLVVQIVVSERRRLGAMDAEARGN